ncbi:hypothetical protein GCK72_000115 [Caenorhabditis remanei]|uniref:Uncharacterized protein n=1 Tax=Caenorhabditis remanei TaxID=31234 RepID=A0A6A5HPW4_CAERE|nr:hypothetical protein GCK72_000115 [Caenorhabditis remanei]KAF1768303.1 hypothetical protein GCK72_000115 [Caenorhabditis remanei]
MRYTWQEMRELVRLALDSGEYDSDTGVPDPVFDGQIFREAFPLRTPLGLCAKFNKDLAVRGLTETELLEQYRIRKVEIGGKHSYKLMPDENREFELDGDGEAQQPEPRRRTLTLKTFFNLLANMVSQLEEDNHEMADLSNQIAAIKVNEREEEAVANMVKSFLIRGLEGCKH